MNKILVWIWTFFMMMFFSAPVNEVTLRVEDYFPIRENTRSVFAGQGNEFAAFDVFIDYATPTRVQQRISNGGTVIVDVIEIVDGQLVKTLSQPETYYRENLLEKGNQEEILLMEPLKVGTTWVRPDNRTSSITELATVVTTPYGSLQALEVTTTGDQPNQKQRDYYVKDLGLVKSVYEVGDNGEEISSSLASIEEGVAMTQAVSFFYPNLNDGNIEYHLDHNFTDFD
jgi:hypothetical protein